MGTKNKHVAKCQVILKVKIYYSYLINIMESLIAIRKMDPN